MGKVVIRKKYDVYKSNQTQQCNHNEFGFIAHMIDRNDNYNKLITAV